MEISNFTMTKHAVERVLDMAVDPLLVRKCLSEPHKVYPSIKYPECDMYRRRQVICCVERASGNVVTVLWSTKGRYRADLSRGAYGGRELHDQLA